MSKRAEEAAMKVYPVKDYNKEPSYVHTCDTKMLDKVYREVFKLGYMQAEKDLGWISVKDRLPEKSGYYITCVERDGKPKHICADDYFDASKKEWLYKEECIADVDYWMEIPKLPMEEKQ